MLKESAWRDSHRARAPDGSIVVIRQDPITPRRITLQTAESKLVVEKEVFRTVPFLLERMHRRRGYQHPQALEDAWASR